MSPTAERISQLGLVGVGGSVGALVRWAIGEAWTSTAFPWPTLLVNVLGSGLLALVTSAGFSNNARRLLAAGVCGGLTTFSTLSVDVVRLLDDDRSATAAVYVVASVVLGLGAFVAARSLRPLAMEERS